MDYVTCLLICQMIVGQYWLGSSDVPGLGKEILESLTVDPFLLKLTTAPGLVPPFQVLISFKGNFFVSSHSSLSQGYLAFLELFSKVFLWHFSFQLPSVIYF